MRKHADGEESKHASFQMSSPSRARVAEATRKRLSGDMSPAQTFDLGGDTDDEAVDEGGTGITPRVTRLKAAHIELVKKAKEAEKAANEAVEERKRVIERRTRAGARAEAREAAA